VGLFLHGQPKLRTKMVPYAQKSSKTSKVEVTLYNYPQHPKPVLCHRDRKGLAEITICTQIAKNSFKGEVGKGYWVRKVGGTMERLVKL